MTDTDRCPSATNAFAGFEPLTANYIYCPNQFFDVLLPHASRGTLRLVAYLTRRTLGWLDDQGRPIEKNVSVSYAEFTQKAGISRGAVRPAIQEAIADRYIERLVQGRRDAVGQRAESSQFTLRWDQVNGYAKTSEQFAGFYAGEGHRTPIPNAFFDHVIPHETLAVVKVVGTVLRHTVGYQNQFGGRRSSAPLSYSYIQDYTKLSDRSTLSQAVRRAIAAGYIECVREGNFVPGNAGRASACYSIRWLIEAKAQATSSKSRLVQPDQFKIQTEASSTTRPGTRFKNPTSIKTSEKDTSKQQPAAVVDSTGFNMLREAGFDDAVARELAAKRGSSEIEQQIKWLPLRNASRNRLGLLRKAIEENWAEPAHEPRQSRSVTIRGERCDDTDDGGFDVIRGRRRQLLVTWQGLPAEEQERIHHQAIEAANAQVVLRRLTQHRDLSIPPTETLLMLQKLSQVA